MEQIKQTDLVNKDSWEFYAGGGSWFKANMFEGTQTKVMVVGVESREREGKNIMLVKLDWKNKIYNLELNINNREMIHKHCKKPSDIIGRWITLEKIKTTNPKTKMLVDSLIITKVD